MQGLIPRRQRHKDHFIKVSQSRSPLCLPPNVSCTRDWCPGHISSGSITYTASRAHMKCWTSIKLCEQSRLAYKTDRRNSSIYSWYRKNKDFFSFVSTNFIPFFVFFHTYSSEPTTRVVNQCVYTWSAAVFNTFFFHLLQNVWS